MKLTFSSIVFLLLFSIPSFGQWNSQELTLGKKNGIYMNGHKLKTSEAAKYFRNNAEAFEHFENYRLQRFGYKFLGITSFITPWCILSNVLGGNGLFDYIGVPALYSLGALGGRAILKPKAEENGREAVRLYNYSIRPNSKKKLPGL